MEQIPQTFQTNAHWYDKTWLVMLLLFLFFPVGLYGLWKSGKIKKETKKTVAIFMLIFYFICGLVKYLVPDEHKTNAITNTPNKNDTVIKQTVINNIDENRKSVLSFVDEIDKIDKAVSIDIKQMKQFSKYYESGKADLYELYKTTKIAKNTCNSDMMAVSDIPISNNFPDSIKEKLSKAKNYFSNCYSGRVVAYELIMNFYDGDNSGRFEKMEEVENELRTSDYEFLLGSKILWGIETDYNVYDSILNKKSKKKIKKANAFPH